MQQKNKQQQKIQLKYVLITGGSSGIGFALAKQFAADGYDCIYAIKAAVEKAAVDSKNVMNMSIDDFNKKLVAAMTQIQITGATGTMSWTADGETVKAPLVLKIVNGKTEVAE